MAHGQPARLSLRRREQRPQFVRRHRCRGIRFQRRLGAHVVGELAPAPAQEVESRRVLPAAGSALEQRDGTYLRNGLPQTQEVAPGGRGLVRHVVHQRPPQRLHGGGVANAPRQRAQHRQLGRVPQVERPAGLVGQGIVLESDLAQRLQDLAAAVVHTVGPADEGDHGVPVHGFMQQHLGVAGDHDLAAVGVGHLAQQLVGVTLAQDFEVGVGLVQQQHGARVGIQVGQQQQRLLQPASGGGEIEGNATLAIRHHDFAAFDQVAGWQELNPEQELHTAGELPPPVFRRLADPVAQVAQHLGGAALADAHVDRAGVEAGLGGRQSRQRRQQGDAHPLRLHRNLHPRPGLARVQAHRPAVERLLVGVVELQAAAPGAPLAHAVDDDLDTDAAGAALAPRRAYVPHPQIAPQQVRLRYRKRDQVAPVHGYAGTHLRHFPVALLVPALQPHVPQRERLQRRGLARVVGADEDHRVAQLDDNLVETFEIANGQSGQHGAAPRE